MMLRTLVMLGTLCVATVGSAIAQQGECDFIDLPDVETQTDISGALVYVTGRFLVRCANGAELRANQGTLNRPAGELLLVGEVFYQDRERTLTAAQATYTSSIRRLYATGDVVFTDRLEGMTIRGPELEYFATTPTRPEAQVNAGQRPHLTLQPKPSADQKKTDPLEIDADRMTIIGKNDLSAFGSVVIKRPDLDAKAEEATYDGDTENLVLRKNAVIKGKDNILRGEVIQAQLEENALRDVHARTKAVLEADDLTVTAPDLHLFFRDELVDRTVARGGASAGGERPIATSRTFRLEADSIDALAPGQKLREVIAIGRARGETIDTTTRAAAPEPPAGATRDSVRVAAAAMDSLIGNDWIIGDTITGYFAAADTAGGPTAGAEGDSSAVLERIVARGAAQSLYRMEKERENEAGTETEPARKAISFVSAEVITLRFRDGEVDETEVTGVRRGLFLDPAPPPTAPDTAPAETAAAARPD